MSLKGKEGKEKAALSVYTSADPIREADARKASEVANGNEEQRCRRGRRADIVKGPTVPQVTSVPTLAAENALRAAKGVTVGDEGVVNDGPGTILSHPLPPPTPEGDGCTSVARRRGQRRRRRRFPSQICHGVGGRPSDGDVAGAGDPARERLNAGPAGREAAAAMRARRGANVDVARATRVSVAGVMRSGTVCGKGGSR